MIAEYLLMASTGVLIVSLLLKVPKAAKCNKISKYLFCAALIFLFTSTYVWAVSVKYKLIMNAGGKIRITEQEAEYFAIQTFTTVGYGKCLCDLPKDPNIPLTFDQKCAARAQFHRFASIAMICWPVNWLMILAVVITLLQSRRPSSQETHSD